MKKKMYLTPDVKVKTIVEDTSILAGSNPQTITISDDPNDVITSGTIDAKQNNSVWDEDEEE